MKSLLNALQEGRLIELPVTDKSRALEYLAVLLEAIPDIASGQDLVKDVNEREKSANTGLGKGLACPHVRGKQEGDMFCAVGWSPDGIDYGSSDGQKVRLVVMYYIPDNQRNSYLKELSGLAKAFSDSEEIQELMSLKDIQSIRNKLLDWVEEAISKAIPDAKARMIKLEARQVTAETPVLEPAALKAKFHMVPFSVVVHDKGCMVLSPNQELADVLEKSDDIARMITGSGDFELGGFHIAVMDNKLFSKGRTVYEAIALKVGA